MPLRTLPSSSSFEEERVKLTNLSNPQDVDHYCFTGRPRCNGALSASNLKKKLHRGFQVEGCVFVIFCLVNVEAVTWFQVVIGFSQMKRLEILKN